jgi:hypothetical protein
MSSRIRRTLAGSLLLAVGLMAPACDKGREGTGAPSSDPELSKRGTVEVTAKLVEIPDKAIFDRQNYNYATVLKYHVLEVHRGKVEGDTIYVAHYNPAKPRSQVADRRVTEVGGNLKEFRPGQVHRMALDKSEFDNTRVGILNRYREEAADRIYWALWTDLVGD